MIQLVPALLERARTTLPDAFRTGRGRPYDDPDITAAIDRQHARHIRDVVLPRVLPLVAGGGLLARLEAGARVAELGCGGDNRRRAASSAPRRRLEVSDQALAHAAGARARQLANASVRDARVEPLDRVAAAERAPYDVIAVRRAARRGRPGRPDPRRAGAARRRACGCRRHHGEDGVRNNLRRNPAAKAMFAFSVCLCMSCALSEEGGAGLGTLGFSNAVANEMLGAGGFGRVRVLLEQDSTRWFEVMV